MFGNFAHTSGLNLFGDGSFAGGSFGGTDFLLDGRGQLDADALAFISTATALTGGAAIVLSAAQQSAVHFLVSALKWQASTLGGSLWSRCIAIYPFLGADGTGTGGKLNALDLKRSFDCTLNGTLTHNANGVTGNGTTSYLNTGLTPSANLTLNNQHISVYSRSKGLASSTLIGADNITAVSLINFVSSISMRWGIDTGTSAVDNIGDQSGFFIASKNSPNMTRVFRFSNYGKFVGTQQTNAQPLINVPFYILARNASNTPSEFSSHNVAFASFGLSLSDTDMSLFARIVRSFQEILGRRI